MFCYYLLLGVCILNLLSESVNFQALKFCWKVQGELWFNKVSRAMRFNSQSVVVVSSFNHHCLCHCWFWTTTQLLGFCSEKKKFKCSFAYQESDLARQKNNTFGSYAESERVRFSNPMARESLLKHQKKKHHIQVDRDLKRLKTHDFYLPPPRKMKPHQVLPKKTLNESPIWIHKIHHSYCNPNGLAGLCQIYHKKKTPQLSAEL